MRSLLARLTFGLVLSLMLVFAVQWWAVDASIDRIMADYVVRELREDAAELASALTMQPGATPTLAIAHFDPVFLTPGSGRYFEVRSDGEVAVRSLSLGENNLAPDAVHPGDASVTYRNGPHGESLVCYTHAVDRAGRHIAITVAADLQPLRVDISKFLVYYAQVSAFLFVLLVLVQCWLVRRALAPLRRVQGDVARLERGEIAQLHDRVPAELLPLVRETNRLLAVLSQRLERSRNALGDLVHALKTPLTVLMHTANSESIRNDPLLSVQLVEQLRILRARIDRELKRARVAGAGAAAATTIDLRAEIEPLVDTLRKLHQDRSLEISHHVSPTARFRGDREDLLELFGNLLDNACKWARRRVEFAIVESSGITVSVDDDGPGCPPADIEKLAQRGVRLDESTAGHGLGLAIARDIVASYRGEMRFGRSETLGGFRVTVSIPAWASGQYYG
jgi:signal transduction histidine kinase